MLAYLVSPRMKGTLLLVEEDMKLERGSCLAIEFTVEVWFMRVP